MTHETAKQQEFDVEWRTEIAAGLIGNRPAAATVRQRATVDLADYELYSQSWHAENLRKLDAQIAQQERLLTALHSVLQWTVYIAVAVLLIKTLV